MEFKPYRPEDRETCGAIIRAQVGAYLAPGEEEDFERFLDAIERNSQGVHFWLATKNGRAVGCAGLSINDDEARLLWGILAPGALGKGFGQQMLDFRMEWIKANHPQLTSALCHTAPLTEGFFAKNGFEVLRRQAKYWGGELELVVMRKTIG